jgi:hypothetical protein
MRDIAEDVGITERAAAQIVNDLVAAGYLTKTRDGAPQPLRGTQGVAPTSSEAPPPNSWGSDRLSRNVGASRAWPMRPCVLGSELRLLHWPSKR